ncbi:MAG: hypothetical protein JXA11_07210 [Phycisphaerae bacterium]|nr:hypothetical protein [Phycisphaerae bacterium]
MRRILFFTFLIPAVVFTDFAVAGRKDDDLKKIVKSYALRGTLESVIPQLEKFGGVQIVADWRALKAAGVEKTEKVRLRGTNEKFINIVDLLLAQVSKEGKPLAWRQSKSGTLHLTTQAAVLRERFREAESTSPPQTVRSRKRPKILPDVHFEQCRLEDILETLRQAAKVNFFINWSSLETVGVSRDTPVSIRAKNISIAKALDLTMLEINGDKDRYSSVYWVIDKGLVRIDTGEVLNTVMRTRVEDVTDLLRITPNFQGPRMKTSNIGALPTDNGKGTSKKEFDLWEEVEEDKNQTKRESPAELRENQKTQLIECIKNSIGRDMWYPNGKGEIKIFRNQLVITQSLLGWKLMRQGDR